MNACLDSLTTSETSSLTACEARIEKGRASFLDVADALAEIRDGRLYREGFATFEAYCRERWGFTRQHVNRVIKSAEAVRSLSDEMEPMGSKITNERTARAVAQVAPEVRVEVVREASEVAKSEGRPMTARDVEYAAMAHDKPAPSDERPRPTDGLIYANLAIQQLQKIQPRDAQRAAAFARVRAYLDKHGGS